MTVRERKEHAELSRLWVSREATLNQMIRCVELDHKRAAEHCGTKAIRVTEITQREWFRTCALTLAQHHKRRGRGGAAISAWRAFAKWLRQLARNLAVMIWRNSCKRSDRMTLLEETETFTIPLAAIIIAAHAPCLRSRK